MSEKPISKHYLIAGGAGFIGSHLCDYLIGLGYRITVWDNLSSSTIAYLNPAVKFVDVDICNISKTVYDSLDDIDGIFNLACISMPYIHKIKTIETLRACTVGVENLLKLAISYNVPILQVSSSKVYGNPTQCPQRETYRGNVSCFNRDSYYNEAIRISETICYEYRRKYSAKIKIARVFNTYGSYSLQEDDRVVNSFVYSILENRDIVIHNSGKQIRTFCHVNDIVYGLYRLFIHTTFDGPVNLGHTKEISINELAHTVKKVMMSPKHKVVYHENTCDVQHLTPDISQAWKYLKWRPKITLQDGIRFMVKDIKSRFCE